MSLAIHTAATVEPVTVAEIKTHLRIDSDTEDAYIETLGEAARAYIEDWAERQMCEATWTLKLDAFPLGDIEIPRPPLSSVTSITYVDTAGDTQTMSSDDYTVDTATEPGRVRLAYDAEWPTPRTQPDAVTVTFVAGYGDAAADVPSRLKAAIKLLAGHWYENREAYNERKLYEVHSALVAIVNQFRVWRAG